MVLVSTIVRRRRGTWGDEAAKPTRQPSRVARLLALAHHLQRAVDSGVVANRATIARAFGLTRARVTQVLDLLLLSPDIQELVLASEAINSVEAIRERDLRAICRSGTWETQRKRFGEQRDAASSSHAVDARRAARE